MRSNLIIQNKINHRLKGEKNILFIQVGANNGILDDPLRSLFLANKDWNGIFVEPVQYLFNELKKNYGEVKRFIFENIAIGNRGNIKNFYYVSRIAEKELATVIPWWYSGLGTFYKKHIIKLLGKKILPYIITEKVQCFPLAYISKKYKIKKLDLLHIDTEGFDYFIIKQIDFLKLRPKVILFEHIHIPKDKIKILLELFIKEKYDVTQYGDNALAISI
jgi:FkbM family methyltransferase